LSNPKTTTPYWNRPHLRHRMVPLTRTADSALSGGRGLARDYSLLPVLGARGSDTPQNTDDAYAWPMCPRALVPILVADTHQIQDRRTHRIAHRHTTREVRSRQGHLRSRSAPLPLPSPHAHGHHQTYVQRRGGRGAAALGSSKHSHISPHPLPALPSAPPRRESARRAAVGRQATPMAAHRTTSLGV